MTINNLVFNGINGATGSYLLPEISVEEISKIAQRETFDPEHLIELKHRYHTANRAHLGFKEGVDVKNFTETGWGIIFAFDDGDKIAAWKEALKPLLDLRKEQTGKLYKEYLGQGAYRPGESKNKFLARHGIAPGSPDPGKIPYYLMIVGSPETIPYSFQIQLAVQYAVGRIHFDTLEKFSNYAQSVVRSEQGEFSRSRKATFFGVQNPMDMATNLSAKELTKPLSSWMKKDQPEWTIQTILKKNATKENLAQLFECEDGPAFLFTASHGMGFPKSDPRQLLHQGALLCQDWPGPIQWMGKPIPEEFYFSAEDLTGKAKLGGMISFHFACYGAGTPQKDDFAHAAFQERFDIAPHSFIAQLPQRLLSHPNGGALAVIGHVERAWGCSFIWEKAGIQRGVFENTIKRLVEGHPVGSALEYFNLKYAEISTMLTYELEEIKFGQVPNDLELANMWTANNDARSYIIIGDPAVRLPI
jgi:hypothetical protein